MKVIEQESIVMCDVDDTLIMWHEPTVPGKEKITINFADKQVYLTPHNYHVDLIKMYNKRGYCVFVWSANGKAHAAQVVEALGLVPYVDYVMTKPSKHMDDSTDPGSILGPRVYCPDLTKPKATEASAIPYGSSGFITLV